MTPASAPATQHRWTFFRAGGLDQVALETAEDLLALGELDQTLWVALSCPIKGLELDEQTLALIDADGDGRIHVQEVVAAVRWAAAHLKRPGDLLAPRPALPLEAIDDLTDEGKTILSSAKHILASLGKPDAGAISVDELADTAKILAAKAPNGDGLVTLRATSDPETRALIEDILATTGGVPDGAGGQAVNAEKVDAFFAAIEAYLKWLDAAAAKDLPELGPATASAARAVARVRPKVEEFFARCRIAAFDPRATEALERQEAEFLSAAAKDLAISESELAAFPLARATSDARLPLREGVNPAWRDALADVHRLAVTPLLGDKTALGADEWAEVSGRLAPYESWIGSTPASPIEKIGAARARELLGSPARRALADLIAQDKALAPEFRAISSVARLARYHRDLRTLLLNFVNFAEFYAQGRLAAFQAGVLFLDQRSCDLCIRVADANAHAGLAATSKTCIAYLDCVRAGGAKMTIAACFTQGDSDYLFVGRNGLFYDRQGRDWDARIVKIIDNPIGIRQAFWSPYKKFVRLLEEQAAKRAASAESASTAKLQTAAAAVDARDPKAPPAAATPAAPPRKFDVGTIAALGVALGALSTAFGMVFGKFVELPAWQIPLVLAGVMLAISLPSMAIAWLKIRQRTIGPLLEANGWAINGRVKINIPFGTALTKQAALPRNARRIVGDPYNDRGARVRRILFWLLLLLLAAVAIAARVLGTWPFAG